MTERPDWLDPALAYLHDWLGYQMRITEQPGCAVAVAYKGEVMMEAAFGHADLGSNEALTPRHRHRVASHSKSFTATAILKLREQGRLKLDDRAGDHVSGLSPEIAAATLAQLLSHTAGVERDGTDCEYWQDRKPFLNEAELRAELAAATVIEPALRLKYSNHGFGLLGLVIEAVTGEPYGVWVTREVVDAAGLTETAPDAPLPAGAPFARGHSGKALLGRRLVFPGDQSTHALAPATGFVSTAADLVRFFGQLAPTAEQSVLSVESRREMSRQQWKDPWSAADVGYGLGTMSGRFDGWDWFGHGGGFQGYLTRTATIPAEHLTLSCLTNAADGPSTPWQDGIMAILKRFREAGPPSADLADWTGRWWSVWGASDLVPVGDKVLIAAPGLANPLLKVAEVTVTGRDEGRISQAGGFGSFGEPVRLIRDSDARVTGVKLAGTLMVPEPELAAELTGKYERP